MEAGKYPQNNRPGYISRAIKDSMEAGKYPQNNRPGYISRAINGYGLCS